MSTGLLASSNLNTTVDAVVYTAPATAGTTVVAKIFIANRNNAAILVRVGLGATGESSVDTTNAIEWDVTLPPFGVLERGNIMLGPSQRIIARTGTANVSVAVCGVVS
jgi:hypothetical protein